MTDLIPDTTNKMPSATPLLQEEGNSVGLQSNSSSEAINNNNNNRVVTNGVAAKKAKGKRRNQIFERDMELDDDELELEDLEELEDEEPEGSDEGSDARGDDPLPATLGDKQKAISKTSLLNRMCRLCGQETQTNRKVHFFTQTGVSNDYRNRLVTAMRFLNDDPQFDLSQTDTLPHFFCRKCHTRLLSFERAAQNLRLVYAKGLKVFKTVENGTHPSQLRLRGQQGAGGANDAFQASSTHAAVAAANGGAIPPAVKIEPTSFEILARASQTFHQPTVLSTPPPQQGTFPVRPGVSTNSFVPFPQILSYPGYLPQQQQQQQPQQVLAGIQAKRPVSQVDSPTADSESKVQASQTHLGPIGNILSMPGPPMFGVQQYGYPFHVTGESFPGMLPAPSPFSPMNFSQAYGFLPQGYFAPSEPQAQVRSLGSLLHQPPPPPPSSQALPQLPVPMRTLPGGETPQGNQSLGSSDPPKRS